MPFEVELIAMATQLPRLSVKEAGLGQTHTPASSGLRHLCEWVGHEEKRH